MEIRDWLEARNSRTNKIPVEEGGWVDGRIECYLAAAPLELSGLSIETLNLIQAIAEIEAIEITSESDLIAPENNDSHTL